MTFGDLYLTMIPHTKVTLKTLIYDERKWFIKLRDLCIGVEACTPAGSECLHEHYNWSVIAVSATSEQTITVVAVPSPVAVSNHP